MKAWKGVVRAALFTGSGPRGFFHFCCSSRVVFRLLIFLLIVAIVFIAVLFLFGVLSHICAKVGCASVGLMGALSIVPSGLCLGRARPIGGLLLVASHCGGVPWRCLCPRSLPGVEP